MLLQEALDSIAVQPEVVVHLVPRPINQVEMQVLQPVAAEVEDPTTILITKEVTVDLEQ